VDAFVALLRGINVGGHGLVRMAALKAAFERAGLADVRTYLQSGNVVFRSRERDARALAAIAERATAADCGVTCRIIIKPRRAYERIVHAIPDGWNGTDKAWRYNVLFLHHTVDRRPIVRQLDHDPALEQLTYCPGALLWAVRSRDVSRSRVARLKRQPLYQDITVRNLNTTRKLYDLLQDA
jgi:uncharacterized protein (DUF1697 family)